MNGLQDIKKRIKSISSTHKLTAAMKLIAASQLRQTTRSLVWARRYEQTLMQTFIEAFSRVEPEKREAFKQSLPVFFRKKDPSKPHIICVLGANKGLCGGYNLFVIHEAIEEEKRCGNPASSFIPLTAKTSEYFLKHKADQTEPLAGLGHFSKDDGAWERACYVLEHMENWFKNEEAGSVSLVSGQFVNTLVQKASTVSLFPFWDHLEAQLNEHEFFSHESHVIPQMAPSGEDLLRRTVHHLVLVRLYRAFIESEACECAARMTMMESSKHNAEDLMEKLSLQYNRTRQSNITNELIEIIAGTSALEDD